MDPRDALRLTFIKDAILAVYASRATVWQTLQGAAIASMPIASVAALAGQFSPGLLPLMLGSAGALAAACSAALVVNQRIMERDLRRLLDQIARMKPGG